MFVIAALLAIMLHEVAHGYAAKKNGDYTAQSMGRLTLNPVKHFDIFGFGLFLFAGFGWAKPVPINPSNFNNYRKGLFWVSIAGVLTNFVLAFFSYPLYGLSYNLYASSAAGSFGYIVGFCLKPFFLYLFIINLSLGVFNLLPIYPLDGYRIIESRLRQINPFVCFMQEYGMYILIGVMIFAFYVLPRYGIDFFGFIRGIVGYPIIRFWGLFGL
jgi:Zn-dependent protease